MTMKAETMEEFAEDYMRFEDSIHQRFTDFDRAFHHALPERKSVVLNRWKAALEDYQEWIGDLLENFKDMEKDVAEDAAWKAKDHPPPARARAGPWFHIARRCFPLRCKQRFLRSPAAAFL